MRRLPLSTFLRIVQTELGEPNARLSRGSQLRYYKRGSLLIDADRQSFMDFEAGVGGNLLQLLIHLGVVHTIRDALRYVESFDPTISPRPVARQCDPPAPSSSRIAYAHKLLRTSVPIKGTLAEQYLSLRAINRPASEALRFHPRVWNVEAACPLPALLARITQLDDAKPIGVQRIFLSPTGSKADVGTPKKTTGMVHRGGVVLSPFDGGIVVGEGVETTMSAAEALQLPGVATLGTANMKSLRVPPRVAEITIAYDRDPKGAGYRAAVALAERLSSEGKAVFLAAPPGEFKDWNDAAQAAHQGKEKGND